MNHNRPKSYVGISNGGPTFRSTKRGTAAVRCALILAVLSALLLSSRAVQAQTETVFHSFGSLEDGSWPNGSLVFDKEGNLYGTTEGLGSYYGGTAFKLTPTGDETVLHSFGSYPDGYTPQAGLILDKKGNLYGTTYLGGTPNKGTVFKLTASGAETVLYSFGSQPGDGSTPNASLVFDQHGNLYGTTEADFGTVFKLTASGIETVLHTFGGPDGLGAYSALTLDKHGNLYSTTWSGGANNEGTVFKVTPNGDEAVIYSFGSQSGDGTYPLAGLVFDNRGNFYGTTFYGGAYGQGTVFKVTPNGDETVVYSFGSHSSDGLLCYSALVRDKKGNLYGTTALGGVNNEGTVFQVSPTGDEKVVYSFGSQPGDGTYPFAGLVFDKQGNLYGTTFYGGAHNGGTVFKLTP